MDVAEHLRTEGYRLTPQRKLVWEALRSADRHLTAEEIHTEVAAQVPDFNVASVYRTLSLLAELGLAKEVRIDDGPAYWELAHPDDEFHLVCVACGTVAHHRGTAVDQVRTHLASEHGFQAQAIDLVVHGICAGCGDETAG